jgi:site-specific recombinase XerD
LKENRPVNTSRAYTTYGKQYLVFADTRGMVPNDPVTVGCFMRHALEERGLSRSTIVDSIPSAVNDLFRYDPEGSPTQHQIVQDVKKVVKAHTAPARQKLPVTVAQLVAITKGTQPTELSIRNTFMMLVMFMGCLRESEAASLGFKDVWVELVEGKEVLFIFVEKSKVDQFRHGHTIVLEANPGSKLCPVRWFKLHLKVRRSPTHVFHAVHKSADRLTSARPNGIIKSCLLEIGVDPDGYGSHSLRRGGATAAVAAGVEVRVLKRHGNWKSDAVYLYIVDSMSQKLTVSRSLYQALRVYS